MPELPEVETVCRGLEPLMVGKTIKNIILNRNRLRNDLPPMFKECISGQKVYSVKRRGKYIVVQLADYAWIMHLGMSGKISNFEKSQYINEKHDHVVWEIDEMVFAFNDPRRFGDMTVVNNYYDYKPLKIMGPEPFEVTEEDFFERLISTKRPLKTALLDQVIVAGLGNIYVCEALWQSNLSPFKAANTILEKQAKMLLINIKEVLAKAIEAGGSSLRDYKKVDNSKGSFQKYFQVYNREGQKCLNKKCSSNVSRENQGGRSTYFCPTCQKI